MSIGTFAFQLNHKENSCSLFVKLVKIPLLLFRPLLDGLMCLAFIGRDVHFFRSIFPETFLGILGNIISLLLECNFNPLLRCPCPWLDASPRQFTVIIPTEITISHNIKIYDICEPFIVPYENNLVFAASVSGIDTVTKDINKDSLLLCEHIYGVEWYIHGVLLNMFMGGNSLRLGVPPALSL